MTLYTTISKEKELMVDELPGSGAIETTDPDGCDAWF